MKSAKLRALLAEVGAPPKRRGRPPKATYVTLPRLPPYEAISEEDWRKTCVVGGFASRVRRAEHELELLEKNLNLAEYMPPALQGKLFLTRQELADHRRALEAIASPGDVLRAEVVYWYQNAPLEQQLEWDRMRNQGRQRVRPGSWRLGELKKASGD